MKDNKMTIVINKPIQEVFNFSLNPANTPLWIADIEIEETNEWPAKQGTIYRNKSRDGVWRQYKLTELVEDSSFLLVSNEDNNFYVRYSFKALSDQSTEFEYREWVSTGSLSDPFTQDHLEKLKIILEGVPLN